MRIIGSIDPVTRRCVKLHLEAHTAADEALLTGLVRAFQFHEPITVPTGREGESVVWDPDGGDEHGG